jgi:hypothetical protein
VKIAARRTAVLDRGGAMTATLNATIEAGV